MRLAERLVPPTNKWFSGLVFSKSSVPVFMNPLSARVDSGIVEIGLPVISAQKDVIFAPHRADITLETGADAYEVVSYDDLTVRVALTKSGARLAELTLVQGSPFVYMTLESGEQLDVVTSQSIALTQDRLLFTVDGREFGAVIDEAGSVTDDAGKVKINAGQNPASLTFFAVPDQADVRDEYFELASNAVVGSSAELRRAGTESSAVYTLETRNGGETVFAAMPHHTIVSSHEKLGSFETLYGQATLLRGTAFTHTQETVMPDRTLSICEPDKKSLLASLEKDVTATRFAADDTYFGGKELYRAANLLTIADQLGATEQKEQLQKQLRQSLDEWFDPRGFEQRPAKYFYFDDQLKGIVGEKPSFGSDAFNDHHFHYGYFIYAAATLARYDDGFVDRHGAMVDALVNDIMAAETSAAGPRLRSFDAYWGHSWASGFSDFGDGNNQESSSEAVNAWYAAYMWGLASDNKDVAERSQTLYAMETETALAYWLSDGSFPRSAVAYEHQIAAINWSGKRDYATFFSPRPQAMLGIQLIPMSPGHSYLTNANERIERQLAEATNNGNSYGGQFSDYLVMYLALDDINAARTREPEIADADIDSANSRTYLQAWLSSIDSQNSCR